MATGCGNGAKEGLIPGCEAYVGDPDLEAACVSGAALGVPELDRARTMCDSLPPPRNVGCRSKWVFARVSHQENSRERLLVMCGGAPDCVFAVFDAYPRGDYAEQVAECRDTGRFEADCVGHAAQRLLATSPTDEQLRAAAALPFGERLAGMLPGYLACTGRTVCPDLGPVTSVCEATRRRQPDLACAHDSAPAGAQGHAR